MSEPSRPAGAADLAPVAASRRAARDPRRRGAVLIACVAILGMLSLFALSFASILSVESRAAANVADHVRARLAAEAGVERALFLLTRSELQDPVTSFHAAWTYRSQDGRRQGHGLALERAHNPSFKDGSVAGLAYSGVVAGEHAAQGDQFVLQVADAASKLSLASRQERLPEMLDALGRAIEDYDARRRGDPPGSLFHDGGYHQQQLARRAELLDRGVPAAEADALTRPRDPVRGRGAAIVELRRRLGGRITSLDQLRLPPAGLDAEDLERLRDHLGCDAWLDTAMVGFGADGREVPQPRAPVNVNTASWPVLVACFEGLRARKRVHLADGALEVDAAKARELATAIEERRLIDPGEPFRGWTDLDRWLEGRDREPPAPRCGLNRTQRALLAANANPNLIYPRRNPDGTVHPGLGKSDLERSSTELCFISYGVYEVASLGRVLDRSGLVAASTLLRATLVVYDTLRLLTQADFEAARTSDELEKTASFPSPVRSLTGAYLLRTEDDQGQVRFEAIADPALRRRARIQSADKRSGYVQLIAEEPSVPRAPEVHAQVGLGGTTIEHTTHLLRFGADLAGEVWHFDNPGSWIDGTGAMRPPAWYTGPLPPPMVEVPGTGSPGPPPVPPERRWMYVCRPLPAAAHRPVGDLPLRVHAHAVAALEAAGLTLAQALAELRLDALYTASSTPSRAALGALADQLRAGGRLSYDEDLSPDGLIVRPDRQRDLRYPIGPGGEATSLLGNRSGVYLWFKLNHSESQAWTPLLESWQQLGPHAPLGPGFDPPERAWVKWQVEARLVHDATGAGWWLELRSRRWSTDRDGALLEPELWRAGDDPLGQLDARHPDAVDFNAPIYARRVRLELDEARAAEWHYLFVPFYTNVHMLYVDGLVPRTVETHALRAFDQLPAAWAWPEPRWPAEHCRGYFAPGGFAHPSIPPRPAFAEATIDDLLACSLQLTVRPPRAGGAYLRDRRGWVRPGDGSDWVHARRYSPWGPDHVGTFSAELPAFAQDEVKVGRILWTELLPVAWGPQPYAAGDFQSQGTYRYSDGSQRSHLSGQRLPDPPSPVANQPAQMSDEYVRYWRLRYLEERIAALDLLAGHYARLAGLGGDGVPFFGERRGRLLAEKGQLEAEREHLRARFPPLEDPGAGSSIAFGARTELTPGARRLRLQIHFLYFDRAQQATPPPTTDGQPWWQAKVLNVSPALEDVIVPYQERARVLRLVEER